VVQRSEKVKYQSVKLATQVHTNTDAHSYTARGSQMFVRFFLGNKAG